MNLLIKLDILTKTKIINHCKSSSSTSTLSGGGGVNGQLLGIHSIKENVLEITDCYPIPTTSTTTVSSVEDSSVEFQLNVLKHLREVNSDYTTIGFYQSSKY
jgi:hypothetical protein